MLDFNEQVCRSDGTLTTLKNVVQEVDRIKAAISGQWTWYATKSVILDDDGDVITVKSGVALSDLSDYDFKIIYKITSEDELTHYIVHTIDGSDLALLFDETSEVIVVDAVMWRTTSSNIDYMFRLTLDKEGDSHEIGGVYFISDTQYGAPTGSIEIYRRPKA